MTDLLHARTFAQRGAHVPFTTPMLATARARAGRDGGIEFVLPNPAGTRGVIVTDLAGATRLHGASLHDTMLCRRLADRAPVQAAFDSLAPAAATAGTEPAADPRAVRQAALAVAAQGYAGPAAAAAAKARQDADTAVYTRLRAALLAGFPGGTDSAAAQALGAPRAAVTATIESLATSLTPLGLPADDAAALPRLLALLAATAQAIADWQAEDPARDPDAMAQPVALLLAGAAAMGAAYLTGLRRSIGDPATLLRRSLGGAAALRPRIDRALWLMDGWERLALLWQAAATTAQRRHALLEIAHGRPLLPAEALSWSDPAVHPPPEDPHCRITFGAVTRLPPAAALALTRRNEAVRAMSL